MEKTGSSSRFEHRLQGRKGVGNCRTRGVRPSPVCFNGRGKFRDIHKISKLFYNSLLLDTPGQALVEVTRAFQLTTLILAWLSDIPLFPILSTSDPRDGQPHSNTQWGNTSGKQDLQPFGEPYLAQTETDWVPTLSRDPEEMGEMRNKSGCESQKKIRRRRRWFSFLFFISILFWK